ncbi:hypothetical protein [Neomoorella thermoacetica]|uniref:hypothetical protein n=1 Tax=Neomoorella thermoacetica TaxID=1525 RepID=UPI0030D5BBCB
MKDERIFASLLRLPGVSRVNAVRSQGSVKHFNVTYTFDRANLDAEALDVLARLWPFCTIEADPTEGSIKFEFLVRPEEVSLFQLKANTILERVAAIAGGDRAAVTLTLEFDRHVPPECEAEMRASLRGTDCLESSGRDVVVHLPGCKDVAAVEERLLRIAGRFGLNLAGVCPKTA